MEIVIGFDFECAGGIPEKHGFTQLGASAHELDTGVCIGQFNQYANMKGLEWEERCVREFWSRPDNQERYKETLEQVENAQFTCKEVVNQFIAWAREISKGRKCVMISDNMIYDGGLIKYYSGVDIMYLLGERTVYFETASVYYGMYMMHKLERLDKDSDDLSSKSIALAAASYATKKELEWPKTEVNHDHHPVHDAENMVLKWIFIQNSIKS